jgi:hypothetical protein
VEESVFAEGSVAVKFIHYQEILAVTTALSQVLGWLDYILSLVERLPT